MNAKPNEEPKNARHLLSFTEAGKIIGLSRMTVAKWVDAGELQAVQMPRSRQRRIERGVFMAYIDSLRAESGERSSDE